MSIIIYLLNVYYNLSSVKKRRSQEVTTGIFKNRVEETVPGGLIRFREKFIASRLRWESSLKLHQREARRRDRDSRQDYRIRLPGTPSYRFSRACRIYRRDVCWSMVSGNPSSSDLVTDNSLANRLGRHSTRRWRYPRSFPIRDA